MALPGIAPRWRRQRSPPKPLACVELAPAPSYPHASAAATRKLARLQSARGMKLRTRHFQDAHTLGEQTSIVQRYEHGVRDGVAETAKRLALERAQREAAAAKARATRAQESRRASIARADAQRMQDMAEMEFAALLQTEPCVSRALLLAVPAGVGPHSLGNVLCENYVTAGSAELRVAEREARLEDEERRRRLVPRRGARRQQRRLAAKVASTMERKREVAHAARLLKRWRKRWLVLLALAQAAHSLRQRMEAERRRRHRLAEAEAREARLREARRAEEAARARLRAQHAPLTEAADTLAGFLHGLRQFSQSGRQFYLAMRGMRTAARAAQRAVLAWRLRRAARLRVVGLALAEAEAAELGTRRAAADAAHRHRTRKASGGNPRLASNVLPGPPAVALAAAVRGAACEHVLRCILAEQQRRLARLEADAWPAFLETLAERLAVLVKYEAPLPRALPGAAQGSKSAAEHVQSFLAARCPGWAPPPPSAGGAGEAGSGSGSGSDSDSESDTGETGRVVRAARAQPSAALSRQQVRELAMLLRSRTLMLPMLAAHGANGGGAGLAVDSHVAIDLADPTLLPDYPSFWRLYKEMRQGAMGLDLHKMVNCCMDYGTHVDPAEAAAAAVEEEAAAAEARKKRTVTLKRSTGPAPPSLLPSVQHASKAKRSKRLEAPGATDDLRRQARAAERLVLPDID